MKGADLRSSLGVERTLTCPNIGIGDAGTAILVLPFVVNQPNTVDVFALKDQKGYRLDITGS